MTQQVSTSLLWREGKSEVSEKTLHTLPDVLLGRADPSSPFMLEWLPWSLHIRSTATISAGAAIIHVDCDLCGLLWLFVSLIYEIVISCKWAKSVGLAALRGAC